MTEIDEQRIERAARAMAALYDPAQRWITLTPDARAALTADADYLKSEIAAAEARGRLSGLSEAAGIADSVVVERLFRSEVLRWRDGPEIANAIRERSALSLPVQSGEETTDANGS